MSYLDLTGESSWLLMQDWLGQPMARLRPGADAGLDGMDHRTGQPIFLFLALKTDVGARSQGA